jgi:hypothetical protein
MAITKVQSVQGQGMPSTKNNVKSKEIGIFPAHKSIQKQSPKKKG